MLAGGITITAAQVWFTRLTKPHTHIHTGLQVFQPVFALFHPPFSVHLRRLRSADVKLMQIEPPLNLASGVQQIQSNGQTQQLPFHEHS